MNRRQFTAAALAIPAGLCAQISTPTPPAASPQGTPGATSGFSGSSLTDLPGVYKQENVLVTAGKDIQLGNVQWDVPRAGNWLAFEIGYPDRDTREFVHGNDFFMPYLYKAFTLEFPNPLVYTVGISKPDKDWNYAQASYHPVGKDPQPWPWDIKFNLPASTDSTGDANLVLAFAGAGHKARVQVSVNGVVLDTVEPDLVEGNSLLRQGSHDKYSVKNVKVPMSKLHPGSNTIELLETGYRADDTYVMYDYVTLEMPGTPPAGTIHK
jgi:rhamnogalacturonan endolyase